MTFLITVLKIKLNVVYLFLKLFKRRKQITLISRQSNEVTLDFKLLEKELKKELKEYKIVVLCKKLDNKFFYMFHMIKQMYNISRSEVVILDSYCIVASVLKHKKNLKIIQIWHALGLMKKAGYAIIDKEEGRSKKTSNLLKMHKNYNYVFTSSNSCINSMVEVFGCKKDIISSVPLPRIDLLRDKKYQQKKKQKITLKYPILKEKENVLYAPSYRKDESVMQEKIDELCLLFDFTKYNLIIKLHPLSNIELNNSNILLAKEFNTMDMLFVSDYVISDYSSIIYEAGILNKKQIFYAFDLDEYKGKRGFFINYKKEIPGPIFKTGTEIMEFFKKPEHTKFNTNLISKYVDLRVKSCTNNMVNKIKKIMKEK